MPRGRNCGCKHPNAIITDTQFGNTDTARFSDGTREGFSQFRDDFLPRKSFARVSMQDLLRITLSCGHFKFHTAAPSGKQPKKTEKPKRCSCPLSHFARDILAQKMSCTIFLFLSLAHSLSLLPALTQPTS